MYPAVELVTGALWAWMMWRAPLGLEAVRGAVFFTLLLGIAVTDARTYIIPDEFTLGGLVAGVLFALAGGLTTLVPSLLGAAVGFALLWTIGFLGHLILKEEAMGAAT